MLYRIAQAVNASYGLAVAWMYIAAFVASLSLLFIFPQVTLLLFFLGLASLGLTIGGGWLIDAATRSLARRSLANGRCPRCHHALASDESHDIAWTCMSCGSEFGVDGSELVLSERDRFVDQSPTEELGPLFDADGNVSAWHGT